MTIDNRTITANKKIDEYTDVKEKLKNLFNLSEKEITVYLTLLSNEKLRATEVSKITGIQRSRTYDIFRCLKDRGLVILKSGNPQQFSAVSPRAAIDSYLFQRRKLFEEESSTLFGLLPTLQRIWNDQHEELLGSRVSLITEDLVREIIPIEIKTACKKLCLAIRDPSPEIPVSSGMFSKLFNVRSMVSDLHNFFKCGVLLHILVGDPNLFLEKTHPHMLEILLNGIVTKTIEVRALNEPFPQSFLLVDGERLYLFFLAPYRDSHNEAIRAESQTLREFFSMVWRMFWEKAISLDIDLLKATINNGQFK